MPLSDPENRGRPSFTYVLSRPLQNHRGAEDRYISHRGTNHNHGSPAPPPPPPPPNVLRVPFGLRVPVLLDCPRKHSAPPTPSPCMLLSYYPAAPSKLLSVAARWRTHQQDLLIWQRRQSSCHCEELLWFQINISVFSPYFIFAKRNLMNRRYTIPCLIVTVLSEKGFFSACVCIFGLLCIFKGYNKTHAAL